MFYLKKAAMEAAFLFLYCEVWVDISTKYLPFLF